MASDAHAHPFDLSALFPGAEQERKALGIHCAASAWNEEQFLFHEALSRDSGPAKMVLCFGVHPQLPRGNPDPENIKRLEMFLEKTAGEKRLAAVGETGFDFFDEDYRATREVQERIFRYHLSVARESGLPLVLHIRKAMDRVFYYAKDLAKLPAVIFHSYSGTFREAGDLLKRRVNAYYSFGTPIVLNHKKAMEAAALLDPERLLTETDAPYQTLRNNEFSSWKDIHNIIEAMAKLRKERGSKINTFEEVEHRTDANFRKAFFQ